ncbi:50S ribosomal protein L24 [Desulfitibacter alkalitolerans]|uniref:50S ribosomal protein L24 n=1 Tax=Desulfitibacter alkalitolerans TaxID=264641 RepID=UPI00047F812E|nr:50S ribosomal protein L24 [Desulfitibacter alkalitolerans]
MATPKKVHVKKGDKVMVISGKDSGKIGKVLEVMPKANRVVVEGVGIVKRHTRPTKKVSKGGIIEQESAIHASNVMYYCSKCKKPVRTGALIEGDKKIRVCKKCGGSADK